MSNMILEADLTWTGARFERDVRIHIEHGVIVAAGAAAEAPDRRLRDRALLPGFVNAHSHVFQRGGDPASGLDAEQFRAVSLEVFREMRAAGVTCVGEFHYLRHATKHDTDYAFDEIVLDSAREAGLRIAFLSVYYDADAVGKPRHDAPWRFRSASPDAYWKQMDRLLPLCEGEARHLGAAVHSIRAAGRDALVEIYNEARRRGFVFHLQFEETREEVERCRRAYGLRPMELLLESVDVGESTTCIHGAHTDPDLMERYARAGGNVCLCPVTEGDPGVAIDRLGEVQAVALGTDSNVRVSPLEDMRRLELGRRGAAVRLLQAGTVGGARALGLPAGRIAPRCWADFVAVDLTAPSLEGWTDATLAEMLVRDGGADAIAGTCVAGRWAER
ncbi:MAG: amidohydrolase family protein [Planctomycetota bacterium]|jgi:formimidoylglutamate deiminase